MQLEAALSLHHRVCVCVCCCALPHCAFLALTVPISWCLGQRAPRQRVSQCVPSPAYSTMLSRLLQGCGTLRPLPGEGSRKDGSQTKTARAEGREGNRKCASRATGLKRAPDVVSDCGTGSAALATGEPRCPDAQRQDTPAQHGPSAAGLHA